MAPERVADMTVEELKALIAEVVNQQLNHSIQSNTTGYLRADGRYILPHRTPEEQRKRNQAAIELLRKWVDEGDEEEQRETLEYLQQALDEDRLSNRPLFPQKQ